MTVLLTGDPVCTVDESVVAIILLLSRLPDSAAAARPLPSAGADAKPPPPPPQPVAEPTVVPPEPVRDDAIKSASLDDLNKSSPLKPIFFEYDSSELTAGRRDGAQ